MGAIVLELLILQNYISSIPKIWKKYISLVFRKCFKYSGDFSANEIKKTGLIGFVYNFSVDEKAFEISNTKIHMYSMK